MVLSGGGYLGIDNKHLRLEEHPDGVEAKCKALSMYRGVMRPYPHPRSDEYISKHPIKDDYPGCWGVATFASNTKSHDDKGRGRPGDCLLRREQDQLQTAPV